MMSPDCTVILSALPADATAAQVYVEQHSDAQGVPYPDGPRWETLAVLEPGEPVRWSAEAEARRPRKRPEGAPPTDAADQHPEGTGGTAGDTAGEAPTPDQGQRDAG